MQTQQFQRKAFVVEAVRVTQKNINEVAKWCGGTVQKKPTDKGVQRFIKVKVHRPLNEKQTQAFIGDWVVKAEAGFKVYTNRAFGNSFEEVVVYTEEDAKAQLGEDEPEVDVVVTPGGNIFADQAEGLQELRTPESTVEEELSDEELEFLQAGGR
jgi:hypothetical protein